MMDAVRGGGDGRKNRFGICVLMDGDLRGRGLDGGLWGLV